MSYNVERITQMNLHSQFYAGTSFYIKKIITVYDFIFYFVQRCFLNSLNYIFIFRIRVANCGFEGRERKAHRGDDI